MARSSTSFKPGNELWKLASPGRPPAFKTPEEMWNRAVEYFEWVNENPLTETKAWQYEGQVITEPMPKMRAMTIHGLCIFLNIHVDTFNEYQRNKPVFSEVTKNIRDIIYNQKFEGASAGLLNANIIARDLGLADKTDSTNTNTNINHNIPDGTSPQEAAQAYLDAISGRD